MDLDKYMTFSVEWKKYSGEDSDTMMPEFGETQISKCFKYGKSVFLRESENSTVVSAKAYLTTDAVSPKDMYDGQIVKSVNDYPESWDSRVILKEVLIW